MPYPINYTDTSDNPTPITVQDQSINQETSLTFVGKNYPGYAQFIGENFLHLLENFASNSEPSNPVKGQLWYKTGTDSSPAQPKLMIYDGVRWTESGSVKKGNTRPQAEISVVGDLWVDIANQQLYLFSGSTWVLVGPQFSEGSLSGVKAEEIIDRDTNTGKWVLVFYSADSPVAILSKFSFVPKVKISGFETIKQGINLSTDDFDGDGLVLNKFWGTSEKADALVVGNNTVPAANFLRSDAVSTTNFTINIRNGSGLNIGDSLETSLTTASSGAILYHKTPGSPIVLRTTTVGGLSKDVITVSSNERVGINNISPTESLDVNGNILNNGTIKTTSNQQSTSTITGSLITAGGAGIGGSLFVGDNSDITGRLTIGTNLAGAALLPRANEQQDIGNLSTKFRAIYSKEVRAETFGGPGLSGATFTGTFYGSVTGSATSLSNTAQFSLRGDVTSNVIPFNGSQPVPNRTIAAIQRSAAGVATITTTSNHDYISGYIVTVNCPTNTSFNTVTSGAVITVTGLNTFTYTNPGAVVAPTSATGTVIVNPGGSFVTAISDSVISDKVELTTTQDSDYFLVYRASAAPSLRKISKSVLFSTAGTVPTASIFPFAGDTAPPGYLLCDGSEQSQAQYPELFNTIGFKYGAGVYNPTTNPNGLKGFQTFKLPDLRGRFALGKENMDNGNSVNVQITAANATRNAITALGAISATFVVNNSATTNGPFQTGKVITGTGLDTTNGPVVIVSVTNNTPASNLTTIVVSMPAQPATYPATTGLNLESVGTIDAGGGTPSPSRVPSATDLGNAGGTGSATLTASQLPQHSHTLKGSAGNQYYALRYASGSPTDTGAVTTTVHNTGTSAQLLPTSGNVDSATVGQPIDIMNPFQTVNYIIFTGRIL